MFLWPLKDNKGLRKWKYAKLSCRACPQEKPKQTARQGIDPGLSQTTLASHAKSHTFENRFSYVIVSKKQIRNPKSCVKMSNLRIIDLPWPCPSAATPTVLIMFIMAFITSRRPSAHSSLFLLDIFVFSIRIGRSWWSRPENTRFLLQSIFFTNALFILKI